MLVGVTGKKGSGKDTFAAALTKRNFLNLKFADPLKEMLRALYRVAGIDPATIERKIEGDLKEVPCEILRGQTPRFAMQKLGTEWAKMIDPEHKIWSEIFYHRAEDLLQAGASIVATDVRFQHEHDVIRELDGQLVRVHRPGTESRDTHASELEMEGLEADETVYNVGSVEELHNKATTYLQENKK